MISANRLKAFEFFRGFGNEQLEQLAVLATEEIYDAGAQVHRSGDTARALFMIEEGKVVLIMDSRRSPHKPPMQVTVDVVTKGDSMGWSAVVEPYAYTLGALCIDRTKIIAIDAAGIRKLMEEDKALGYQVMKAAARVISHRLTHTRIILVGERGLSMKSEY